jgi:hypothetical protein
VRRFQFIFAIVLALGANALHAQARPGRIRGVVIDSILGAMLPGATVHLAPLNRSARTDSAGRFVFDSVPTGEWSLSFDHPALDSLRLTEPAVTVRVFAGATAIATLATRGFDTLRDVFCAGTPDSLSPTLAFGTVHTADGSRAHMDVSVTWMLDATPPSGVQPGTVQAVPEGDQLVWFACGISEGSWFHATVRDSTHSSSVLLRLGQRGVIRHDLYLTTGVSRVTGVVRDNRGRALPNAHVSAVDTDLYAVTDAAGSFTLNGTPNGSLTLDVRAEGYRPWLGAIKGDRTDLEVPLQPQGASNAAPASGSDYFRLVQRRNRRGLLLVLEQELTAENTTLASLVPAETCRRWLDGRLVDATEFLAPSRASLRALELYMNGSEAPPEYRSSGCAVVLLWTARADW